MDKIPAQKVETFKSGHFVFSSRYDKNQVSELLAKADNLYTTIKELPILPSMASELEEEIIRRAIFGTAALEGNPLTEEQVAAVIEADDNKKSQARAEREIQNLQKAYSRVRAWQREKTNLALSEGVGPGNPPDCHIRHQIPFERAG